MQDNEIISQMHGYIYRHYLNLNAYLGLNLGSNKISKAAIK